jgi:hypothetical protein
MKIEILNPIHPGFYESILTPYDFEEQEYKSDDSELGGFLSRWDLEIQINYKDYNNQVSSKINDFLIKTVNEEIKSILDIENLLGKKIKEDLDSPRFYNYGTDRSFFTVEVDEKNFKQFIDYMFKERRSDLSSLIEEQYTSCDGFHSFYSNDIEEWERKKYNFDHNELQTIFLTLLDREESYYYDDLIEIAREIFDQIELWYEWTKNGQTFKYTYWELEKLVEV